MSQIHISNVLLEFRESPGQTHRLQFIYAQGKKLGQIGELECTYGTGKVEAKVATSKQPRMNAVWKNKGTFPVFCIESKRMKTLLISHLRKYDGYIIKH